MKRFGIMIALAAAVWGLAAVPLSAENKVAGRLDINAWEFDRGNVRVSENPGLYGDYRDYRNGDAIELQIFRADVHDHRDSTWGWTAYSRPRLEIGHFLLHTVGKPTACQWRKDLWNAELAGTITTDKGTIRIRRDRVDGGIVCQQGSLQEQPACAFPEEAISFRDCPHPNGGSGP